MKFSEKWLRTFADPALTTPELADVLTMAGIEVEEVQAVAPAFENVVVAEVLDMQKHPNADRLNVCKVNAGGGELQIVCGAPNVRKGMRAPLARVGAKVSEIEIKKAKMRGVESEGMLCSAKELGIADEASGLLELAADAPVGTDVRKYLELDDHVITIKPTPNRGDCLSIRGVAREVSAITGSELGPFSAEVKAASDDRIKISIDDATACPRYCGRIVHGVNARAATPDWMKRSLERSGLRSISAVVDVTNYVMLELGQPLHAFDLSRIAGGIHVRFGREREKLKLLNDQEVELTPQLLVIADETKALALAGIMGGADSAVTLDTRDLLLESAFFDPNTIAGKSRLLGFDSDSSYRFERGVDFAFTKQAIERATQLVLEICGGQAGPVCDELRALPARDPVRVRRSRVARLLGIDLSSDEIAAVLKRLGFAYSVAGDEFSITPPSYRFDLSIEEDFVEEIARIHGYNRIPASLPHAAAKMLPAAETRVSVRSVKTQMVARDYQEIVSYSFVAREWEADFADNENPVALANPIAAHLSVMRSSLLGSLVDCLKMNLSRQQDRVRLFETGRCFNRGNGPEYNQVMRLGGIAYGPALPEQWGVKTQRVDFYDAKSDVEALVYPQTARFEVAAHPALHSGRSARLTVDGRAAGWLGELHPGLCQKHDLPFAPMVFELNLDEITNRSLPSYQEFSRQPQVRRDLSVEVPQSTSCQAMLDALNASKVKVVSRIDLFDVYRGKGIDSDKKSVAFRILLQDTLQTLTDAEVEAASDALLQVLQEQFQAKLRR